MTHQDKFKELAVGLDNALLESMAKLSVEVVEGEEDVNVLVITVEDREEFPIYITVDESQILCITHLWKEEEVDFNKRVDLLDAMLTMNVPMPLSSFSKVGGQYLIFGALSIRSTVNEVLEELDVLSDNTLTAIEELRNFLTQ